MSVHILTGCVCGWIFCSVGQALVYHLSDIKGMSLWPDKFGAVGLSETASATQDAVRVAGSFMLKARELQQSVVISLSLFHCLKSVTWCRIWCQKSRASVAEAGC